MARSAALRDALTAAPSADSPRPRLSLESAAEYVRVALAGLTFEIGPASAFATDERAFLGTLPSGPEGIDDARVFRVALMAEAPWPADMARFADRAPARVDAAPGGRVRVMHRRFMAEIDPFARTARLFRDDVGRAGLMIALRVALSAWLPRAGGLPLHAAGVNCDGVGLAFFGPSGAGKTTLAGASPHPVLSDELVAAVGPRWRLEASGFWGARGDDAIRIGAPLGAMFELDKGSFSMTRLDPGAALRHLIGCLNVPPEPALWGVALSVAGRLVREVPVYRLAWTPGDPPWERLRERLLSDGALSSSSLRG